MAVSRSWILAWIFAAAGRVALAQVPFQDTTLANGLQVVTSEDHRLPRAVLVVAVRTGAVTQDSNQAGLAHMYEHALFRAYPKGGQDGFNRDVSRIDGAWNGETTEDMVRYFLEVAPDKVAQGLTVLATLVNGAKFSQHDLDAERPIVLDEMARDMSTPFAQLGRQVDQVLWGQAWSRQDVIGDSASISQLSVAMLQDNYQRYYLPNNAVLIVSGDVSGPAVRAAAATAFGNWNRGPDPFAAHPVPAFPTLTRSRILLVSSSLADVTILLKIRAPRAFGDSADAAAMQVLCDAMDGGSIFGDALVPGLFQSLSCSYDSHRESASMALLGRTTQEHAVDAFLALLNEMTSVADSGTVDEADLAVGNRYRLVEDAVAAQYANRLAFELADDWAGPGMAAVLRERARLAAVTPADVRRVAATYLVQATHVIGVMGRPSVLTALRQRLSGGNK